MRDDPQDPQVSRWNRLLCHILRLHGIPVHAKSRMAELQQQAVGFHHAQPFDSDGVEERSHGERCHRRALMGGYVGLCVLNLFAFRATDPTEMKIAKDPVGGYINTMVSKTFSGALRKAPPTLFAAGDCTASTSVEMKQCSHGFGTMASHQWPSRSLRTGIRRIRCMSHTTRSRLHFVRNRHDTL